MNENQLKRMFSQVKPAPGREEAMLAALLTPERKVSPMKKIKKATAVLTAAALLLMTCAFTVMTDLDQRLLEFLGVQVENTELLSPVARPVDVNVTDNGATLNVRQVLMDRTAILFQLDFTAPEDMKLDGEFYRFDNPDRAHDWPRLVAQDGTMLPCKLSFSSWGNLTDENQSDNRISMSFMVSLDNDDPFAQDIRGLWFPAVDLVQDTQQIYGAEVLPGDWSCEIPLDVMTDSGWIAHPGQTYEHELLDLTLDELYLSPMHLSLALSLKGENPWEDPILAGQEPEEYTAWIELLDKLGYGVVTLTSPEGRSVEMQVADSLFAEPERRFVFLLSEIIDPAEFQNGILTIAGQSFALDDLTPVSAD